MKRSSHLGLIILTFTAVIWGFAFVAQLMGSDSGVPPFCFNFFRFTIGAVSLIPVVLIFERNARDKATLKTTLVAGIAVGVILAIASALQQFGIVMTDSAGKSGFITGLYMILVPILGIFMRRRTGVMTWIGAVLGVAGLFLVCMSGSRLTFTKGDVMLLLCAVMFAMHIIVIDRFADKIYSLRFAMIQFATAAVVSLFGALISEKLSLAALGDAAFPILYCGIMSVGVAYTLQIIGQKHSEPTPAAIVMSTESVFSAIGGAIILHERMSVPAYIGCALIMCGIVLSQLKDGKKTT